jgi:hypothetical protein
LILSLSLISFSSHTHTHIPGGEDAKKTLTREEEPEE